MPDVNLKAPEYYINRELSFLDFNHRVLAQAQDESLPLLERVRFLCISCSNLDEFFEIRVAGLKQRQDLGSLQGGLDAMTVPEQLQAIHADGRQRWFRTQYELLNQVDLSIARAARHPLRQRQDLHATRSASGWPTTSRRKSNRY